MVVSLLGKKCCITEMQNCTAMLGTELEVWTTEEDKSKIYELLNFSCESNVFTVLGLTASAEVKCWPQENYCNLVRLLSDKYTSMKFILLGNSFKQGESLIQNNNVLNLCGQLTLRETVALMQLATLYVGSDTGLMHIASACGCAVIEISSFAKNGDASYGISSSIRFSPWSKEALIVQPVQQLDGCVDMCQMSYAHCIKQVTVEAVMEASCRLLINRVGIEKGRMSLHG